MGTIMFAVLFCYFSYSMAAESDKSENCEILTRFASRVVSRLNNSGQVEYKELGKAFLDIDIEDPAAREKLLCPIADSRNLKDLYNALPLEIFENYHEFEETYIRLIEGLTDYVGGYTNAERLLQMKWDATRWGKLRTKGESEAEKLTKLTEFTKVMQVKYGSRWMGYLLRIQHQDFVIENPEEFARKVAGFIQVTGAIKSEKCEILTSYASGAVAELHRSSNQMAMYQGTTKRLFNVSLDDAEAREKILCRVADSKNLKELYDALPNTLEWDSYDEFKEVYAQMLVRLTENIGGYTNIARVNQIYIDAFGKLRATAETQEEKVERYIDFFKVMQVKYGSRWIANLRKIKHQNFVIDDPEDFAREMAANETIPQNTMSGILRQGTLDRVKSILTGISIPPPSQQVQKEYKLLYKGIVIIGDLGLFNLKP